MLIPQTTVVRRQSLPKNRSQTECSVGGSILWEIQPKKPCRPCNVDSSQQEEEDKPRVGLGRKMYSRSWVQRGDRTQPRFVQETRSFALIITEDRSDLRERLSRLKRHSGPQGDVWECRQKLRRISRSNLGSCLGVDPNWSTKPLRPSIGSFLKRSWCRSQA